MNGNEPLCEPNNNVITQLQHAVTRHSRRMEILKDELMELRHAVAKLEMKSERLDCVTIEDLERL